MRWPSSRISPAAMRPGGSSSPMIAVPVIDLPAPDSPDHAQHLAGRDVEAHVVDRHQRPAPRVELDAQVADAEQGRGKAHFFFPSLPNLAAHSPIGSA